MQATTLGRDHSKQAESKKAGCSSTVTSRALPLAIRAKNGPWPILCTWIDVVIETGMFVLAGFNEMETVSHGCSHNSLNLWDQGDVIAS